MTTVRRSLWASGATALGWALVATLLLRSVGLAVLDIPPEFAPLASPGPTIFFTVVSGVAAVAVFGLLRRRSANAVRLFRWTAVVVLLVSFVPDVWLLSEGAAEAFPGATPAGVGLLMAMHVAAACGIVWPLTRGEPRG